ncbi:MAG: nucleotidyl transferase AbiEii/AbiGii toxin family protein [Elusimicrobiota bacterium]
MDREKLQRTIPFIAEKNKFRLETIEKDYYLTLILNSITTHLSDKIIFKGGTLLNKVYLGYHRLSEDLDFCFFSTTNIKTRAQRSRAVAPIRKKMREFLNYLNLKSDQIEGIGFNNSTQYVFNIFYPSFVTGQEDKIKLEISIRQNPVEKPIYNTIKHFYQDPFSGKDLIPRNKVLSLTYNETVAEKLKAAITRKNIAIRDYYDLWFLSEQKFDFENPQFISIFKTKLEEENYRNNFSYNFGLNEDSINSLYEQVKTELIPVIRTGERFDLNMVFRRFNKIMKNL